MTAMKTATILRYASHSAWPLVVVLAMLLYHRPVSRIIEQSKIKVKVGSVDVELTPREAEKIIAASPVVTATKPEDIATLEKLDTPLPIVSPKQIKRLKRVGLVARVAEPAAIPESGSLPVTESVAATGTIPTNASVELTTWGQAVQRAVSDE